jgi:hypothetical protein
LTTERPVGDAGEAAERLATALEAAGIPHAIGGALAMGVHGYPRGTLDVDLNLFVEPAELPNALKVLHSAGVEIDDAAAQARAGREGMFVGRLDGFRVDVFVPSIPFSHEAARTRVRIAKGDEAFWFLAPEALAIFKLLFFRGKDLADLERFVAARAGRLDHGYVRRWMVDMMGEDDERVRAWDRLVERFGAA